MRLAVTDARNAVDPSHHHHILYIEPTASWQLQFGILHSKITLRLGHMTEHSLHILSNLSDTIENKLAMIHRPNLAKALYSSGKWWKCMLSWDDGNTTIPVNVILENKKISHPMTIIKGA